MPLRGDCGHLDTQGVALGYVLVGLSGRKPLSTQKKEKINDMQPHPQPLPLVKGRGAVRTNLYREGVIEIK